MTTPIMLAYGDGRGPELMNAVLVILKEAEAKLEIETVETGERLYAMGLDAGLRPEAWKALRRTGVLLKSAITVPDGQERLDTVLRGAFQTFARVHASPSSGQIILHPIEDTPQDDATFERVLRHALALAVATHQHTLCCMHTNPAFSRMADALAQDYPELEVRHDGVTGSPDILIVQEHPFFDSSAGLAEIGEAFGMFGIASDAPPVEDSDPSALLMSAVLMLLHIGQGVAAQTIRNAWLKALEDGITVPASGLEAFVDALVERMGHAPTRIPAVRYEMAMPLPRPV